MVVVARSEAIHEWFELTYSSYLVLPRSVLQSMPDEWQEGFVELLRECEEAVGKRDDLPDHYQIIARDKDNRMTKDAYRDYERGRRDIFQE